MNVWNSGSMSYCDLKSIVFFFFKQKTAYEMRISDWSSDVCSSDLVCRQQVDTHNLRFRAQLLDYLSPAARRNAEIDDMPRLPDQPVFLIQFDELVGRAAAIAFRFRLPHIRIVELPLQPTSGLGRPPFRRFDAHPPSAAASSHDAPDPSQRNSVAFHQASQNAFADSPIRNAQPLGRPDVEYEF